MPQDNQPSQEELANMQAMAQAERLREKIRWATNTLYNAHEEYSNIPPEDLESARNIIMCHQTVMIENLSLHLAGVNNGLKMLNNNFVLLAQKLEEAINISLRNRIQI